VSTNISANVKPTEITNKVLYQYPRPIEKSNKRAVLFVHGFSGDPLATWIAKDQEPFPALIASDPDLADFDVFMFSYRTSRLSGDTLDQVARQLGDEIDGPLASYHVIFVAHSMGGLVCMQYILNRLDRGHRLPILGLLMYGTPTTGIELVRIAQIMAFGLKLVPGVGWLGSAAQLWLKSHQQLVELSAASQFLQDMHDQWALRVINGGYPTEDPKRRAWLPVCMVTGTRPAIL
jgi:pimeloyl-ACP methyl ester carboxylesterase